MVCDLKTQAIAIAILVGALAIYTMLEGMQ
jgi:hypothetical protein